MQIDENKFQVFLFVSSVTIPLSFASHPWFVINNKGLISRWEVLFRKVQHKTRWGHLYMNFLSPTRGLEIFPFIKLRWGAKLLGQIEGEAAVRMGEFIENSPTSYPPSQKYFLTGPNSNTYVQWVLNHFPEFKVQLPWNAVGKGYMVN